MKNEMRFQTLIARDVPAELDRRILAAASKRAAELRFRHARRRGFWAGSATAAAAAILVIAGAVLLLPEMAGNTRPPAPRADLLALSDWTSVEQENYNLSFELYSGRQAVSELAEAGSVKGF